MTKIKLFLITLAVVLPGIILLFLNENDINANASVQAPAATVTIDMTAREVWELAKYPSESVEAR